MTERWTDRRMELIVGNILRWGVAAAAATVSLGGAVYLCRHGGEPFSLGTFRGEPEDFRTLSGILGSVARFRGRGIIQLGLLLLMATPVARVAFSVAGFALERDRLYTAVTLAVLGLLLLSYLG